MRHLRRLIGCTGIKVHAYVSGPRTRDDQSPHDVTDVATATRFHLGSAPASMRLALSHHVTLDMMLHQWVPVAQHRTSTLSHSTSSPHVTDITDVQEPDGKTQVTAPSPESVGHKPGENSTHGVVEDHSKQRCCQVSHGVPNAADPRGRTAVVGRMIRAVRVRRA